MADNFLFLDRDKTIVENCRNPEGFINDPGDIRPIAGAQARVKEWAEAGWTPIIISNQGGVSAGYMTIDQAIAGMQFTLDLFPEIAAAYFCTDSHGPGDFLWILHRERERTTPALWEISSLIRPNLVPSGTNPRLELIVRNPGNPAGFRKPSPGAIYQAMGDYAPSSWESSAENCIFVGVRPEDEQVASAALIPFIQAGVWLREEAQALAKAVSCA